MKVYIKTYLAEDEKSYKIVATREDGKVESVDVKKDWEVVQVVNPARMIAANRGIQAVNVSLVKAPKDYSVIVKIGENETALRLGDYETAQNVRLFLLKLVALGALED